MSLRVLIVDDSDDTGAALELVLQQAGHQTRRPADGEAALPLAKEFLPEAALLDIGLAGEMDGHELARRLRECSAKMRIVALTGRSEPEDRVRGREAGFDRFLTKPATPEQLQAALTSV